jgi:hypothetical protein
MTSYNAKLSGQNMLKAKYIEIVFLKVHFRDLVDCSLTAPTVPLPLTRPLLKHPNPPPSTQSSHHPSPTQGFHSGRRSALVCIEGEWYRMKGCGDIGEGITTKEVEDGSGRFREIRGVMFENTTAREICILN